MLRQINADADHHVVQLVSRTGSRLHEDPGDFAPVHKHIVRPLTADHPGAIEKLAHRICNGDRRDKAQLRCTARRALRTQEKTAVETAYR